MHNSPNSRPNMQQIADAVGLSKSAVSLALRNDPRLPLATRLRIKSVADQMGYRRNPVVDNLMTQLRAGRQPSFQANLGLVNCSPFKELNKKTFILFALKISVTLFAKNSLSFLQS